LIPLVWFYLALAIVAVLGLVAVYYVWRVSRMRRDYRLKSLQMEDAAANYRAEVNNSIQILCRALLVGQVSPVEASVRLSGLLNQLSVAGPDRDDFVVFDRMAQAVRHIPMLEAWRRLPKEQRRVFEIEIQSREAELGCFIKAAAEKMLGRSF
jgi:Protein of unknown function (DUF2489)